MASFRRYVNVILTATFLLAFVLGTLPAQAAAPGKAISFEQLVKEKTTALVTVKFILKLKMGGMFSSMGDQESETEVTGVMIDPQGLVLCSNTQVGGISSLIKRFMGSQADIQAKPTDLKVLIGDDTEGLEADFLARDSELDLAWIQIKEPGDKKFDFLDLSKSAKPAIGDTLLMVRRMDKYFDRTIVVGESRLGGTTVKPRELYVPTHDVSSNWGLPVYNARGLFVGVVVMQTPDDDESMAGPMSMLNRMSGMQDMASLILPAKDVVKATKRAKAMAKTEKKKDTEADKPKPAKPKPAGDEGEKKEEKKAE